MHGCGATPGAVLHATRATPPFTRAFAPPRGARSRSPRRDWAPAPLPFGVRVWAARTPPFVAKNGPVVECLSHSPPRAGGRLQPAPAARVIPAGRHPAPPAAGPAGGGGASAGGAVLVGEARRSGDSPRTALTASCARFPASWSRRASAAWSKATCSVWARWAATTAVRRCALRALARGSGGCVPGRPVLRQRRERPGVRRGAQRALASQVCTHTGYAGPTAVAGGQPQCSTLGRLALSALADEPDAAPAPGETPDRRSGTAGSRCKATPPGTRSTAP